MDALEQERYPVGRMPRLDAPVDAKTRAENVATLAGLPGQLRGMVTGLSDAQLDTPYRDGGWTIRQVVHHIADSHMNAYIRMKLAATEDEPAVKTYEGRIGRRTRSGRRPSGCRWRSTGCIAGGLHFSRRSQGRPAARVPASGGTVTIESIGMPGTAAIAAHIAAALRRHDPSAKSEAMPPDENRRAGAACASSV